MRPAGGLRLGKKAGVTVTQFGPGVPSRADPVLFTLTYYGYHDPETKSIRLTALRFASTPTARRISLGGRRTLLASHVDNSGFVPVTQTYASCVERHVGIDVTAQGLTRQQLARFVADLKEEPPPR